LQEQSWYFHQELDVNLMNEAAETVVEPHWLSMFSKVNTDVNTFDCTIFQADWKQENSQLVFTISANRFLKTWCVPSWNISKHRYSQDYAWWFQ
jgi:tRNA pseudouridine38-40 synthase